MAYTDFTLEAVEAAFGLTAQPVSLFPGLALAPAPDWLTDLLERGHRGAALVSEKARSEFLVVPVLLAVQGMVPAPLTIFSGQRLDPDPGRGLSGECDYILARTPPVPRLKAPLVTVLEAKRADIELGLGQCVAQMVGLRAFNERAGEQDRPVYGCVTTGEVWQFLRLTGAEVGIDTERRFIDNVGGILAVLKAVLTPSVEKAG
jgi:hypothetical protein